MEASQAYLLHRSRETNYGTSSSHVDRAETGRREDAVIRELPTAIGFKKDAPHLEGREFGSIDSVSSDQVKTEAYKVNWKIFGALFLLGVVPAIIYAIGVGIANCMGGRQVEAPSTPLDQALGQLGASLSTKKSQTFRVGSQDELFKIPDWQEDDRVEVPQFEHEINKNPVERDGKFFIRELDRYFDHGEFVTQMTGPDGEDLNSAGMEGCMAAFAKWANMDVDSAFARPSTSNPVSVLQVLVKMLPHQLYFPDESALTMQAQHEFMPFLKPGDPIEGWYSIDSKHIELLPNQRVKMSWNMHLEGSDGVKKTYRMEYLINIAKPTGRAPVNVQITRTGQRVS